MDGYDEHKKLLGESALAKETSPFHHELRVCLLLKGK